MTIKPTTNMIGTNLMKEIIAKKLLFILPLLLMIMGALPSQVSAAGADLTVERKIQHDLVLSKILVRQITNRQNNNSPVAPQLARLKELAGSLTGQQERLTDIFAARVQVTERIGRSALERHKAMAESFRARFSDYLQLVEGLPESEVPAMLLEELKILLEALSPERDLPLLGALPYRHLRSPGKTPTYGPIITPAFRGGNGTVTDADLAGSLEAPLSLEIAQLAESLDWSPVAIYGWVKNNIRTEWYWGSMKGAVETLHQRSGNDADQAALLVALLQAADFPARLVRGTVEFFPDLGAAERLTGLSGGQAILGFFQKAGIPCQPLIAGGRIANLQVEHIWVEAEVPYSNYRGVVIDGHGKSWLGLDTAFKVGSFTENQPAPLPDNYDLAGFPNRYLQEVRPETPLEFLRRELTETGAVYENLLRLRSMPQEELQILPASLQFKTVTVTGEYVELPDELRHRARFTVSAGETTGFDLTLPVQALTSHSVAMTYEPVTVEDQEIINSYGGLVIPRPIWCGCGRS